MSLIKICGLKRMQDIEYANELLPDFIGFIFAPKSKRYIAPLEARRLKEELSSKVSAVGVFKDNSIEEVLEASTFLDIIQLHGFEDECFIKRLREGYSGKIIKAFSVDNFEDIYKSSADYILLDNKEAGSGEAFDWSYLDKVKDILQDKCFLAGGIGLLNIEKALSYNPFAIDLSSGAESNGVKDYHKMKRLIEITKQNKLNR